MVKLGLVGYGYWGPNLLRNFTNQKDSVVVAVADGRKDRLEKMQMNYPAIKTYDSAHDLININDIDAVIIATPVHSHYELAKKALLAGKHVLIEKPMTSSVMEAEELTNLAESRNLVLMVDHTFLYTGAVNKIKELIDSDVIGKPKYFDSTRINLGLFQPDVNVLWDLAPHDISMLLYLIDEKPYSVNATGISHTNNNIENIAYMTVNYKSNFIAHFNCSWTSPVKVRQTLIGGDRKMIVYNDLEPSEKVRLYDTGYNHKTDEEKNKLMVDYRTGDIHIPNLSSKEALSAVAEDFLKSILSAKQPLASAQLGLKVVQVLDAAQKSIKNKGKEIIIN